MAQLTVRKVPEDVVRALKLRAAQHGRSAEAEHRALLEQFLRPADDFWKRVDAARAAHKAQAEDQLDRPASRISRFSLDGVLVIDASVAVKWFLEEEGSEAAREIEGPLAAPSLLMTECSNVFWKKVLKQELTESEAIDNLRLLEEAPVLILPESADLNVAALELAVALSHPVYDCLYLALAMSMNAAVVTADARFLRAASANGAVSNFVRKLQSAT